MIPQEQYNEIIKNIPIICVDVVIVHDNKVLLIKRSQKPCKDSWWIVGGRLFKDEQIASCAIRKAKEEVGLHCHISKFLGVAETKFPEVHSVNFVYKLDVIGDPKVILDNTSSDYMWVGNTKNLNLHTYVENVLSLI